MSFLVSLAWIVGMLIGLSVSHSEILPGFVGPIYPFFLSLAVTIRCDLEIRNGFHSNHPAAWRGR